MYASVAYELSVFAGAGLAGLLTAFLYDLFRLKRRVIKTAAIIVHVEDILFWLTAAIIIFLAAYVINSGETRLYFFLGVFTGGFVYFYLLSRMILWTLMELLKALSWPIREIIRFVTPFIRGFLVRFKKVLGKTRKRLEIQAYRVKIDMHRLRNTMIKK